MIISGVGELYLCCDVIMSYASDDDAISKCVNAM